MPLVGVMDKLVQNAGEEKLLYRLKLWVFTNLLEDVYCSSSSNDCFGKTCIKVKIQEIKLYHKSKVL